MTIPLSLLRRLIGAARRGLAHTQARRYNIAINTRSERYRCSRDASTITNSIAALEREMKRQQHPVGRNRKPVPCAECERQHGPHYHGPCEHGL